MCAEPEDASCPEAAVSLQELQEFQLGCAQDNTNSLEVQQLQKNSAEAALPYLCYDVQELIAGYGIDDWRGVSPTFKQFAESRVTTIRNYTPYVDRLGIMHSLTIEEFPSLRHIYLSPAFASSDLSALGSALFQLMHAQDIPTSQTSQVVTPANPQGLPVYLSLLENLYIPNCPKLPIGPFVGVISSKMKFLRTLQIGHLKQPLNSACFTRLVQKLPCLRAPDLEDCTGVPPSGYQALRGLPLISLRMHGCQSINVAAQCLADCTALTSVDLSGGVGLSDGALRSLANLPLAFLSLSAPNLGHDTLISADGFGALATLAPTLTALKLRSSRMALGDEHLEALRGLTRLNALDLSDTTGRVTDFGLTALADLTNLTSLALAKVGGNPRTDMAVDSLGTLVKLRMIDLSGWDITHAGVLGLQVVAPALETLALRGCRGVSYDDVLAFIFGFGRLCDLDIGFLGAGGHRPPASFVRFLEVLPLTSIDVSGERVGSLRLDIHRDDLEGGKTVRLPSGEAFRSVAAAFEHAAAAAAAAAPRRGSRWSRFWRAVRKLDWWKEFAENVDLVSALLGTGSALLLLKLGIQLQQWVENRD